MIIDPPSLNDSDQDWLTFIASLDRLKGLSGEDQSEVDDALRIAETRLRNGKPFDV